MSAPTARPVSDIINMILTLLSNDRINYAIAEFKITINAVEKDVLTPGRAYVYDDKKTPYTSTWLFYGLFEVTEPNSTIDEIRVAIRRYCADVRLIQLRIIRQNPIVIQNPGTYGILIVYQYSAPEAVSVVVR